jgi:hypothetical protein
VLHHRNLSRFLPALWYVNRMFGCPDHVATTRTEARTGYVIEHPKTI